MGLASCGRYRVASELKKICILRRCSDDCLSRLNIADPPNYQRKLVFKHDFRLIGIDSVLARWVPPALIGGYLLVATRIIVALLDLI